MSRLVSVLVACWLVACAKEPPDPSTLMRARLGELRTAVSTYAKKHHHGPQALGDLVRDGELRAIPADPVTGSRTTWKTVSEEVVRNDDFARTATSLPPDAIIEVHSGARGTDAHGKRWSDY